MHETYEELIADVRKQIRFQGYSHYYERHHVVPLNAGGKDEETNLILLTLLEHAEAHYLYAVEHRDIPHHYHANLNSAWLILFGKRKKIPDDKEQLIREFLLNPDMKVVDKKVNSQLKKAERLRNKYKKRDTLHCWITKDGKNKKVLNADLDKYFGEGWRKGYSRKRK